MTNYYRLYLGKQNVFASECHEGGFVGADYSIAQDLSNELPDNFRDFNAKFIPILQSVSPGRNNRSAGLACGMLWTIAKGIEVGDVVLSPTGSGSFYVGQVSSEYFYVSGGDLPHRRKVNWFKQTIQKSELSVPLQNSIGSIATVCDVSRYAEELARLIEPSSGPQLRTNDESIENPAVFALETYLEDFMITNWANTMFGEKYRIYEVDGEPQGRQLRTDTGPLDILAESLDGKELLVLELKKGQASDKVVGQILRYMSWVTEEIAIEGQTVRGAIIALDDDLNIRRALSMVAGIDFYRYEVRFNLRKS